MKQRFFPPDESRTATGRNHFVGINKMVVGQPTERRMFMTNTEKLADVKTIIEKLGKADRETLIYIHGRVDQALADKQKTPA